jgi:hypothetical protein
MPNSAGPSEPGGHFPSDGPTAQQRVLNDFQPRADSTHTATACRQPMTKAIRGRADLLRRRPDRMSNGAISVIALHLEQEIRDSRSK